MNRDLIYNSKIPKLVLPDVYSRSRMVLKTHILRTLLTVHNYLPQKKPGSPGT